jgi:hypothetical protein
MSSVTTAKLTRQQSSTQTRHRAWRQRAEERNVGSGDEQMVSQILCLACRRYEDEDENADSGFLKWIGGFRNVAAVHWRSRRQR